MVATKAQSWDAVLAEHDPPVAEAARAVQHMLEASLPGAAVQFDPGNGLLAIGTSMKMRDLLFAIIPHRAHGTSSSPTASTCPIRTDSSKARASGSGT